ncbi:MAG: iron ABC transporter permease [Planctomycetaceae bacterium]|nr:MAG: iron ABC transporter permease [Planctomycetaceae bacterium]
MQQLLSPRTLLIRIAAAAIVLVVVMLLCALAGSESISLKNALAGGHEGGSTNSDYEILMHIRVPRVILAAIVGAALAAAGVTLQALLRNPLADPYILGISSGAGLGATLAIIGGFSWTLWGRSPVAIFAFAGAVGTVWLVWGIGRITGRFHVTGLLLAGVVVNAFFSAIIMFLISAAKGQQLHATMFWLMGNMAEEDFFVLWIGAGCVAAGVVSLYFLTPQLNAISFNPEDAKSMGIHVERVQLLAFTVSAFVTAVAVSLSGLVGFVGLVVPHAVRLVLGPDHRQLLPISSLCGAMFLVIADTVARVIVAPAQLPVGVVTAMVGGPFFLILLIRYNRKVSWLR